MVYVDDEYYEATNFDDLMFGGARVWDIQKFLESFFGIYIPGRLYIMQQHVHTFRLCPYTTAVVIASCSFPLLIRLKCVRQAVRGEEQCDRSDKKNCVVTFAHKLRRSECACRERLVFSFQLPPVTWL